MALFNRRDSAHQSALAAMERLRRKRAYLVTTTWTAYEALSILKRRMGPEESKLLWARLSDRRLVDLFAVDEAVEREAVWTCSLPMTRGVASREAVILNG